MLKELKILNGNLELEFNEYTYEYTVTVDNSINELEFEYKLEDDCYVNVLNNSLVNDENIVYLNVYNIDNEVTYTLYVYKENAEDVNGIDNYMKSLEVEVKNEIEVYKIQTLAVSIFLILIVIFSIMFRKNKIKNI